MSPENQYLALDLGAESGRGIIGSLGNGRIELNETHRFQTGPVSLPTMYPGKGIAESGRDCSLLWDFLRFWQEIKYCIHQASKNAQIKSVGVDAWGVDFALLDKNGLLLSFPYHYRDCRTDGMMEKAFERLSRKEIYEITGNQFMQLNTLYQLLSLTINDSPLLKAADKLVMIPDLVNFWLTGQVAAEFTEATTSQIFDSRKGDWSNKIISAMRFPKQIFPKIVAPGTVLGPLRRSVAEELETAMTIIAPPSHDTASAISAVPAENSDFIWISSGTWSIIGMTLPEPVINDKSYACNFTNEGGMNGSYHFSKNVTGLWLVQQCRQIWQKNGRDYSYAELTEMAQKAPHMKTIVDPDYNEFLRVGDMVEKINTYCGLTDQPVPQNEGEMIRAILQGLALRYRYTIDQLEEISGKNSSTIHIVGGGTKNHLLNQFTADALGRKVITGPVEATAIGNLIVQAIALGDIENCREGVAVIRSSFAIETYLPGDQRPWNTAYEIFKKNINMTPLAF